MNLGDIDLHLFGEGRHEEIYKKLGAHVTKQGRKKGVTFAVWAPQAAGVNVVGDFNGWHGREHQMHTLGNSGVWELFIPNLHAGSLYKFEIRTPAGHSVFKADPYAQYTEVPPDTSSIVYASKYKFRDAKWIRNRAGREHFRQPLSIYEVHFGSWRRNPAEGNRPLTYREMAEPLANYLTAMGFTHVEFLPLKEHPYGPSWGYQVTYYYAPSARYGEPDDLRYLIDYLHQHGVGVIMDWVPAHFPKDAWALGRFDGSALYEHLDPRKGEHPDWGTYIFNYGRNEVRHFLVANALYWFREFHVDGLRVDAVASMLYLDYSRKEGQWVANEFGGRENLDAIDFLKKFNEEVHLQYPGVLTIAEESTAWTGVSRPTYLGGLGFSLKWNMGWMNDTRQYFHKEPINRKSHQDELTFSLIYAFTENFCLPMSHDEVVHGKGSMLDQMPGDLWQKFANLRLLYAYMWAHPGKKLLFMGSESGRWEECTHDTSRHCPFLQGDSHKGLKRSRAALTHLYRREPALHQVDFD